MDDTQGTGLYNGEDQTIANTLSAKEGLLEQRDALSLELPDEDFIKIANNLITDSKTFFNKTYELDTRRAQNEKYLFGRQLKGVKLKPYNARYIDNIIYESESYIKPMSLSRLPDIVVKPGQDNDVSKQVAQDISSIVNSDIQSRKRRRVLGLAFKHLPVYFTGVIKVFWNPELGADGDYDFKIVHPENIIVDHTASSNDPADMQFVAESIEYSVKEWVMRFPKKEKEFYDELRKTGAFNSQINEENEAGMNSKIKGWEIWYTWYDKKEESFERLECVAWFYNKLVLKNMKNPNWDWEGRAQTFTFDDKEASEKDLQDTLSTGKTLPQEQVFYNYFDNPEKPYILMGYDQWGKIPYDETSRIEQAIPLQDNIDKRGKQITEMLDRARGKHVFSDDTGLTAKDLQNMDLSDPDEDILIKGKVSEAHDFIQGEQPSPPMIENLNQTIERVFDKMGVHGPARGEVDAGEGNNTATQTQISREGDFTRNDDLTDDTINFAAEKMANWILQFIKLRYTKDHMVRTMGDDGNIVFKKINRDMIEDGMEVSISASGTDKLNREQRAMDMAKLKMIDPLQFYQDLNMNDPKGRTEKLMMFMMQPALYLQKFVSGQGAATDLVAALQNQQYPYGSPQDMSQLSGGDGASGNAASPGGATQPPGQNPNAGQMPGQGSPQALQDIMQIQQGQVPQVPNQIDAAYVQTLAGFMQSPQLQQVLQQYPGIKQQLIQFVQSVQAMAKQLMQAKPQVTATPPQNNSGIAPNGQNPAAAQASTAGGSVGPTTGNPQPGNTAKVAANPR